MQRIKQKVNTENALVAVIGDDDTVTGLLLAGVGNVDTSRRNAKNFLVVDSRTTIATIEETFRRFLHDKNIAVILITQNVADRIRPALVEHTDAIPAVLEMPSKDAPYDPSKDYIMQRIERMFSSE
eukprot:c5423_g1_i1.p1 GENE.c5423_g1_i1~~c5423_g1_i1.p1  ORF type:complete len:126 (+),score=23.23 c5423_g1_i1:55-432(+)